MTEQTDNPTAAPAEKTALPDDAAYFVWSVEHNSWWASGGWGYAKALNKAGRYSRAQALDICRKALGTAMHMGYLAELPVRVEDVEEFLAGQMVPATVMTGRPQQ